MEKNKKYDWALDESQHMIIQQMDEVYKDWNFDGKFTGFSVTENEATKHHRDWDFILQEQDATILLEDACKRFSYDLYNPIFMHQITVEE